MELGKSLQLLKHLVAQTKNKLRVWTTVDRQVGRNGDGEEWSDSGHVMETKPMDVLIDVTCEGKMKDGGRNF